MVYLDYSATTPIDQEVLDLYNDISLNYIGNANAINKLGISSFKLIKETLTELTTVLKVPEDSVIVTSGATESNNLVLEGVLKAYPKRNRIIITTKLSHSSIINKLNEMDVEVKYLNLTNQGQVDINQLKEYLILKPILVSLPVVDSELGIKQDLNQVKLLLANHPQTLLHIDATQIIGKDIFEFEDIDYVSFSAHKCYGPQGVGFLYKNPKALLKPVLISGESISDLRGGTPATALTVSACKAIIKRINNLSESSIIVLKHHHKIMNALSTYPGVLINNTSKSIPHIINISILGAVGSSLVSAFSNYDIYLSTMSACKKKVNQSESVFDLYKDAKRAKSTVRISLSHLTTTEEVEQFLHVLDQIYHQFPRGGF